MILPILTPFQKTLCFLAHEAFGGFFSLALVISFPPGLCMGHHEWKIVARILCFSLLGEWYPDDICPLKVFFNYSDVNSR